MKTNAKLISVISIMSLILSLSCGEQAKADPAQASRSPEFSSLPDLKGRKIQAVTENAYPPLNFVDTKTNQGVGWEYDAVNEIGRRLNAQIVWNINGWDTMIAAIQKGQFDVGMDGISINDERKAQIDFSNPYMVSQQFMLVRANENRFTDDKSFAANPKLLIGAQSGTTNFYVSLNDVLHSKADPEPRIKLYETFGTSVQALISGDVDMVLMDETSSKGYMGANPDKLKVIGNPLGRDEFGFIFTKKSDLVDPFNQALKSMVADGTIDKLDKKWLFEYNASK